MTIDENDLEMLHWPPQPRGGQQVGCHHFGLLVIHKPTGIAIVMDAERSQHENKAIAISRLHTVLELCEGYLDALGKP